jgi:hypothetical protein
MNQIILLLELIKSGVLNDKLYKKIYLKLGPRN